MMEAEVMLPSTTIRDRESYTAIQLVQGVLFTLRLTKTIVLSLVQKASWKYHLVSSVLPN